MSERPYVFISYSHADTAFASRFAARLDQAGIQYFRDTESIEWGESIPEHVHRALERTTHLVVLISPGSEQSQWVAYEMGFGRGRRATLVPYLLHPKMKIPGFIADIRYLQNRRDEKEFVRSLRKLVVGPILDKTNIADVGLKVGTTGSSASVSKSKPSSGKSGMTVPRFPISVVAHWSRCIGGSKFQIVYYYELGEEKGERFDGVVLSLKTGQLSLGLEKPVEDAVALSILDIGLALVGKSRSKSSVVSMTRSWASWYRGVYAEREYKLRSKVTWFPDLRFEFESRQMTITSQQLDERFFEESANETSYIDLTLEKKFRSGRLRSIDNLLRRIVKKVSSICDPTIDIRELSVRRYFLSLEENQELGEDGAEVAPALIYFW